MLSLWMVKPTTTGDMDLEQEPSAFGLSGLLALDERVRQRFLAVERSDVVVMATERRNRSLLYWWQDW